MCGGGGKGLDSAIRVWGLRVLRSLVFVLRVWILGFVVFFYLVKSFAAPIMGAQSLVLFLKDLCSNSIERATFCLRILASLWLNPKLNTLIETLSP